MLVAFGYGLFSHAGFLSMGAIYTLVILGGIAQAFDVPARQSFIMEMAGRRSLSNAIALNSATFNGARIIGPTRRRAGAGRRRRDVVLHPQRVFIPGGDMGAPVHARPARARGQQDRRGFGNLLDGVRYVRGHRHIVPLLVLTAAYGLFGNYFTTLLPTFAKDIYGQSELGYGLCSRRSESARAPGRWLRRWRAIPGIRAEDGIGAPPRVACVSRPCGHEELPHGAGAHGCAGVRHDVLSRVSRISSSSNWLRSNTSDA